LFGEEIRGWEIVAAINGIIDYLMDALGPTWWSVRCANTGRREKGQRKKKGLLGESLDASAHHFLMKSRFVRE
jgi:hypothetical protein